MAEFLFLGELSLSFYSVHTCVALFLHYMLMQNLESGKAGSAIPNSAHPEFNVLLRVCSAPARLRCGIPATAQVGPEEHTA